MTINAIIINSETDGAIPVKCELKSVGSKIQLNCGGVNGWSIQVSIEDIEAVIADELHG